MVNFQPLHFVPLLNEKLFLCLRISETTKDIDAEVDSSESPCDADLPNTEEDCNLTRQYARKLRADLGKQSLFYMQQ